MSLNTWHKTHKTWKNINAFLYKNEIMSDCAFLFEDGTTTIKIPSHKYILGGYSPEFYNLFYLMKTDSDEIPITDVSVENFTKFLEFVYTEKTELSLENVGDLIILAVRYSVESFMEFCVDFLIKSITVENALSLLDKYSVYQLPYFETKCIKTMRQNRKIFEDPLFYEISNQTLTTILKSKELKNFKEITIFKGVNKWSEKNCTKNNQVINSDNKRMALGEALKFIRFGAMTSEEFSSITVNLENSILRPAEIINIFRSITACGGGGRQTSCPYSTEKRDIVTKMCDFTLGCSLFKVEGRTIDGYELFNFTANKQIKFHGFGILGRAQDFLHENNPEKFLIILSRNRCVVIKSIIEIKYDGSKKIYELLFNNAVLLDANSQYDVYIKRQSKEQYENYILVDMISQQTINLDGVIFNIKLNYAFAAALIFEEDRK